jgi:hypothetical protein
MVWQSHAGLQIVHPNFNNTHDDGTNKMAVYLVEEEFVLASLVAESFSPEVHRSRGDSVQLCHA